MKLTAALTVGPRGHSTASSEISMFWEKRLVSNELRALLDYALNMIAKHIGVRLRTRFCGVILVKRMGFAT